MALHKISRVRGKVGFCDVCVGLVKVIEATTPSGKTVYRCPVWFRENAKDQRLKERNAKKKAVKREKKQGDVSALGAWRTAVIAAYNSRCALCEQLLDPEAHHSWENSAHAHHIIPRSKSRLLRYDVKNGMLLCHRHHAKVPWGGEAYVWEYMWKNRPDDARYLMQKLREPHYTNHNISVVEP